MLHTARFLFIRKFWTILSSKNLKNFWWTSQKKVRIDLRLLHRGKMRNIACVIFPIPQFKIIYLSFLPKHFFRNVTKVFSRQKGSKILGNWHSVELSKLLHKQTPFFLDALWKNEKLTHLKNISWKQLRVIQC